MISNFYIMAMGRSGTTLLQNILDAHPNIVVAPESFFVLHLHTKYKNVTTWNTKTIQQFVDDLYTDRLFRLKWQIPKKLALQSLQYGKPITTYQEACNRIQLCHRKSFLEKEVKLIGDKNPIYSNFTNKLLSIYPKAKVIHMVRDPRGTANGQINTFNRKDALMVGSIWSRYNKNISTLKQTNPSQYTIVRYEDLVSNTEATVKSICEFLEIPFHKEMMDYQSKTKKEYEKYTEALKWKHKNLLKPIDKKIAEKWKTALTPKQIKAIEYTTQEEALKYGYQFKKPKKTFLMSLRLPFSKLKAQLIYTLLNTYFAFPFWVRKIILSIRSFLWDYKYIDKKANES